MTTLATDDFNRANSSTLGANWTAQSGVSSMSILSNQADVVDNRGNYYSNATWPNDHWSQATILTTANILHASVRVRCATAADTYYNGGANPTDFGNKNRRIWKTVAGTRTSLGSQATDVVANDVIYLEAQGTALVFKVNGTTVVSVTDSSIASGNAGLGGRNFASDSPKYDDWSGGDFSGANTDVNCSLGTVTIAGQSATVLSNVDVNASLGTVTIAGQSASVTQGVAVNATLGTVSINGLQATVTSNLDINASLGAVSIDGKSAVVTVTTEVGAALGTVSVQGLAATILADTNVNCSLATVSVQGLACNVSIGSVSPSGGHGRDQEEEEREKQANERREKARRDALKKALRKEREAEEIAKALEQKATRATFARVRSTIDQPSREKILSAVIKDVLTVAYAKKPEPLPTIKAPATPKIDKVVEAAKALEASIEELNEQLEAKRLEEEETILLLLMAA